MKSCDNRKGSIKKTGCRLLGCNASLNRLCRGYSKMFRLLRDPFWKRILRLRCVRKIETENVFLPLVTDTKVP